MSNKRLLYIAGPTGVGKTALSIAMAKELHTEIISCDARQCYREMTIGTAVPKEEDRAKAIVTEEERINVSDVPEAEVQEFIESMILTGCRNLNEITRDLIREA